MTKHGEYLMFSICTVHSLGAGLDILVAATPITSLTTSVATAAAIAALVVGLKENMLGYSSFKMYILIEY